VIWVILRVVCFGLTLKVTCFIIRYLKSVFRDLGSGVTASFTALFLKSKTINKG